MFNNKKSDLYNILLGQLLSQDEGIDAEVLSNSALNAIRWASLNRIFPSWVSCILLFFLKKNFFPKVFCSAFIINDKCGYLSDVSMIYRKDYKYFFNLKYFIIDCLRRNKHSSHYNLDEVLDLIKILKPKKAILTNLHSKLDYNLLKKNLPKNVVPAFDGLTLKL